MSIFNFWKKNKEEKIKVDSNLDKSISLASILITLMQTYVEENATTSGLVSTLDSNIENTYQELVSLGLGNTANAKLLKKDIDTYKHNIQQIQKAKNIISFVKEAIRIFGENTILISNEQFTNLCNSYKLSIGLLRDYKGVVPIENIKEIKRVRGKILNFRYSFLLNKNIDNYTLFKVDEAIIDNTEFDKYTIKDFLKKHNNIVPILVPTKGETKIYPKQRVPGLENLNYEYLNTFIGKTITMNDFFIACPKKYLDNSEVKISVNPVDPIVFHYCPYGVLIHTAWGEEAEDIVLKKYMEVCKNIKNM